MWKSITYASYPGYSTDKDLLNTFIVKNYIYDYKIRRKDHLGIKESKNLSHSNLWIKSAQDGMGKRLREICHYKTIVEGSDVFLITST